MFSRGESRRFSNRILGELAGAREARKLPTLGWRECFGEIFISTALFKIADSNKLVTC